MTPELKFKAKQKTLFERMSKEWQEKFTNNAKEFPATGRQLKELLDNNTNYFMITFGQAFELALALSIGIEELSNVFEHIKLSE